MAIQPVGGHLEFVKARLGTTAGNGSHILGMGTECMELNILCQIHQLPSTVQIYVSLQVYLVLFMFHVCHVLEDADDSD